jgi:hypothetical protein
MPFSTDFDDAYKLGIKAACDDAGAYCERVDEQHFEGTILNRIYNQIATSDFIIADMSGRNENVFYEVGYAHALNKNVILITRKPEDIPFDLANYPHIIYANSITSLKEQLTTRIRWAITHKDTSQQFFHFSVFPYIDGIKLLNDPVVRPSSSPRPNVIFKLAFRNHIEHAIRIANFRLGILTPNKFPLMWVKEYPHARHSYPTKTFPADETNTMWQIDKDFSLLPDEWASCHVEIPTHSPKESLEGLHSLCVRMLTDTGPFDFPFKVEIEPAKQ